MTPDETTRAAVAAWERGCERAAALLLLDAQRAAGMVRCRKLVRRGR